MCPRKRKRKKKKHEQKERNMGRGKDRRNTERVIGQMEVIQTQILRENLQNGNLLVLCYFEKVS
jgi:hypothetical protein